MPENVLSGPWNHAVSYLELFYNQERLAEASCFFWEDSNKQMMLVSNWHNFAGRNPLTNEPLHTLAGTPNFLRIHLYEKTSSEDINGNFAMKIITKTIPLVCENTGNNLWYEHHTLGSEADIAAIEITCLKDSTTLLIGANSIESDIVREFSVAQDAFIVGYPLGLISKSPLIPVWKRGTIATDPNINPDGKQIIYVDAATRPAMSGSIVLTKDVVTGNYPKKDGTMSDTIIAYTTQVVGIYSGRIGASNIEAQLGIVWKRKLIDEVVEAKKIAKTIF